MKRFAWLLLVSFCFTFAAFADDDKEHHHHEDLNETQLGTVHFYHFVQRFGAASL